MRTLLICFLTGLLLPSLGLAAGTDLEDRLLHVLTPEQARAFADGLPPASIDLPNGETLEEYLARQEKKARAGLVLRALEPCVILDTSRAVEKPVPGYPLELVLRGESRDLESYGGSAEGCGIPDLVGELFRSNRARALLLSVEIRDAVEAGSLAFGSGESLVAFRPGELTTASSLIVPLCDEESTDPCANGDLSLRLEGQAEAEITVHGFLEPVDASREAQVEETEPDRASKASTAPFWEKRTDSDDIYYTEGFVGVGTDSPQTPLSLLGNGGSHPAGITQNQVGGNATMELTTADGAGLQATRVLLRGNGDDASFEVYRGGRGSESLSLKVQGTNGFVGIGEGQPSVPLTIRKSGSTKPVGMTQQQLGGDATLELTTTDELGKQATRVLLRGGGDLADFEVYSGARGSESLILKLEGTNGRLGLGTSEPLAGVHVFRENQRAHLLAERGDGHFTGLFSDIEFSGLAFEDTAPFSIVPMAGIGSSAFNRAFTVTPDSRVGIRKVDPSEALEVDGNIKLSGSLVSDGDICIGRCS